MVVGGGREGKMMEGGGSDKLEVRDQVDWLCVEVWTLIFTIKVDRVLKRLILDLNFWGLRVGKREIERVMKSRSVACFRCSITWWREVNQFVLMKNKPSKITNWLLLLLLLVKTVLSVPNTFCYFFLERCKIFPPFFLQIEKKKSERYQLVHKVSSDIILWG